MRRCSIAARWLCALSCSTNCFTCSAFWRALTSTARAGERLARQAQEVEIAREARDRRLRGFGHLRFEALDLGEHGRGVEKEITAVPKIFFRHVIRGGRGIRLLHECFDRAGRRAIELLAGADVPVACRGMGGLDAEGDDA